MPEQTPESWSQAFEPWDDHPLGARVIRNQDECLIAAIRYPDWPQSIAHANLIVAAPDLLAISKKALHLLTGNGQDGTLGHHPDNPVPAALRAAITPAEEGR